MAHVEHVVYKTYSLPTYVPRGFTHQSLNVGQPRDSPRRSSLKKTLHGGPPFNPPVEYFGWPTFDSCMFIPPWYQPPIVQHVPQPVTKLPYMKLEYPIYVIDTDLDVHIKIFKKAIKAIGEMMEVGCHQPVWFYSTK